MYNIYVKNCNLNKLNIKKAIFIDRNIINRIIFKSIQFSLGDKVLEKTIISKFKLKPKKLLCSKIFDNSDFLMLTLNFIADWIDSRLDKIKYNKILEYNIFIPKYFKELKLS